MTTVFPDKDAARAAVWEALRREKVARFPFVPRRRIPNFAGAREAAEQLLSLPLLAGVQSIKVNPDAPQRPVRRMALERGIIVYMPTPRLKAGFNRFDPRRIPRDRYADAASLSKGARWAEAVPLEKMPAVDVIVTGSVAVTRTGKRCGKGEGYADLEYAILRELGHPATPVVTTVHPLQLVGDFPTEPTDQVLSLIVMPDGVVHGRGFRQ